MCSDGSWKDRLRIADSDDLVKNHITIQMTHIGHIVLERYSFKNLSLFFFKHYYSNIINYRVLNLFPMSLFLALPPGDVSFESMSMSMSMSSEGLHLGGSGGPVTGKF